MKPVSDEVKAILDSSRLPKLRFYWVDPLELTDKATHTEPYCGQGVEASIVVNASIIEVIHQIASDGWGTSGSDRALELIRNMTAIDGGSEHGR